MTNQDPLVFNVDLDDPTVYALGLVVADEPGFAVLVINDYATTVHDVVALAAFLADLTRPT